MQRRWFGPRANTDGGPLKEWEAAWLKSGVARLEGERVLLRLPRQLTGVRVVATAVAGWRQPAT